jgi:hypothetical protein
MKPNRQAIHAKYKGHCAYCGDEIAIKDMQVDHVIPQRWIDVKSHRGELLATHDQVHCEDNYMPACRSCNNYKSGNPLEVFRKMIQNQIDVLRRDRPTFRLAERYGLIKCNPKPVIFYFEMYEAGPRYPDTIKPPLYSEVVAFEQDGTPHLMSVTETWAIRMFDFGYSEWAEIKSPAFSRTP